MTEAVEQTAESFLDAAKSLINDSKFAEAENILAAAVEQFPRRHDLYAEFARVASYQVHWKVAIERWEAFRLSFPGVIGGYSELAAALRNGGRASEALDRIGQIVCQHPERLDLLLEHARCLSAIGKDFEALEAWADIRRKFPDKHHAFLETASLLRRLKRLSECADVLREGLSKFPDNPGLLTEEAFLAEATEDKVRALTLWRQINSISPQHRAALFAIAKSASSSERPEEAIAVLTMILLATPNHLEALMMLAKAQSACGNWAGAKKTLEHAATRHPGNKLIAQVLFEIRLNIISQGVNEEDADSASGTIADEEAHSRADVTPGEGLKNYSDAFRLTELMNQFESLGDNCEFGLVQRYFGAEPLGLLRWTSVNVGELTRALCDRFAGVGEADNTTLLTGGNEYGTRDRNYRMTMHTFQHVDSCRPEILLPQLLRRLRFLKRRLMEDLAEGEKIFVYKAVAGLTDNEIEALFKAISQYGDNRLLCVRESHQNRLSGHIDMISSNLAVGYVTRFGQRNGIWNIEFDSWLDVCSKAQSLFNRETTSDTYYGLSKNANALAEGTAGV